MSPVASGPGPSTSTIVWSGTMTARSSIAHGGQTRGTITLLRREVVVQPDGRHVHVPILSGNGLRGRLRRIGEELLRDVLNYEGQLTLPVAHALRGGGSLSKSSREPLSGRRLQQLRDLVPQIAVFGCAGGGRIIDGCLQVGKVVPRYAETTHLATSPTTDPGPAPDWPSAFTATQLETYARQDESSTHAMDDLVRTDRVPLDPTGQPDPDQLDQLAPAGELASTSMQYRIETYPAGTTFTSWIRLERATALEVAFFADVLDTYAADARLGGRAATGHGQAQVDLTPRLLRGQEPPWALDWRSQVHSRREDALTALEWLS